MKDRKQAYSYIGWWLSEKQTRKEGNGQRNKYKGEDKRDGRKDEKRTVSVDSVLRVKSERKMGDEASEDELTTSFCLLSQRLSKWRADLHQRLTSFSTTRNPTAISARKLHLRKYWQDQLATPPYAHTFIKLKTVRSYMIWHWVSTVITTSTSTGTA